MNHWIVVSETDAPRGFSLLIRRHGMALALFLVVVLTACGGGASDPAGQTVDGATPPDDPEVVATYEGGRVLRGEVDRAILDLPPEQRPQVVGDEHLGWTRGFVRELVLDRLLEEEAQLLGTSDDPEVVASRDEIRRQVIIDTYLERSLPPSPEIDDEAVRRYFDEHPERYDRGASRQVSHLFKRRPPGADLAPLKEETAVLRQRIVAGESFGQLAAEHSDSESRHQGGDLGWLSREQLPAELADVIFALPTGTPSEPLPTAEGVHLFQVEKAVDARQLTFDEVQGMIRQQLVGEAGQRAFEALTDALPSPEGSFVASSEELASLFAAGDARAPVLRMGDFGVDVAHFRTILTQNLRGLQATGRAPTPDYAHTLLEGMARRQKIYLRAQEQGLAEDPEVTRRIERLARRALLRIQRQRAVARRLTAENERLQTYYEANRLRFSSPLRLEVRHLRIPLSAGDPNRAMARLEALSQETAMETDELAAAAEVLGGTIEALGWRTLGELAQIDGRLPSLAADLGAGQRSAPYRGPASLGLLEVAGRREPEPQPLATVLEPVRQAYLADHGQELYQQWVDETLDAAKLEIFSERLVLSSGDATVDVKKP